MENELEDLSNTLLSIYENNLIFLKENFEDIFNRVNTLSDDINSGKIKEKYTLEHRDGYFDILNNETNSWYYGINTYEDADNRAEYSNFTKEGSFNLLRTHGNTNYLSKAKSYGKVMKIIDYINENVDLDNVCYDKIYKMIFIGAGLGLHVHEISKKLDPFTTLIIEPELEVFRLSLFIIDYREFDSGNKKLFLSVEDDNIKRQSIYGEFYSYHNYMNYNVKYNKLLSNYDYIYDELVSFFSTNFVGYFSYLAVLENIRRSVGFIKNKEYFIDTRKMDENKIFKDKKVLIIAAGPSLDNYIDFIQKNQDKFIIICVDVILRKLEKNKIKPNVVVTIDPSHLCAKYLTCDDKDYLNDSLIVCLAQQHEKTIEVIKGKDYIFSQTLELIKEIGTLGSVNNVGTFSYKVAVHFGASEIYTIGNDAAFDQETGSRYSSDSSHTQKEDLSENNTGNTVSTYDVLEMEGNLRDKIKTNRSLLSFKDSFENEYGALVSYYGKDSHKVYNLSDGVKIKNFIPMKYEEIESIIEKSPKIIFDPKLSKEQIGIIPENIDFEEDIRLLTRMINKTNKRKLLKINNKDNFLELKLEFMIYLLEESKKSERNVIGNMFLLYTELVDIYINFLINLKQKNLYTKENLKKIHIIWLDGVKQLFKDLKDVFK
jgi:hypothetical protein